MAGRSKARRCKKRAAAAAGGKDRFEDLPDHVLEVLLSFLPSQEAVQTCVLAKRWRNIWKSVPALRILTDNFETWPETKTNAFANKLIELRDPTAPLHVCEMIPLDDIESWLQYAASREVKVLRVEVPGEWRVELLSNNSVISQDLTRLELFMVKFDLDHSLDLSSCKALEVLDIECCLINLGVICGKSLRHLRITHSELEPRFIRTRISAPGLVTCELADNFDLTPLFGRMPSLTTAFMRMKSEDECGLDDDEYCEGFCCQDDCSVLFDGLSSATNLELVCDPDATIFSKDLRWCPTFGKLKTLLLNDWCVADNFTGLIYLLQHSPILERLTLQLSPFLKYSNKMLESPIPREQLLVSRHLKVVEIKYWEEKETQIHQIVHLLGTLGVPWETINIDDDFRSYRSFSFEQKTKIDVPKYIFRP